MSEVTESTVEEKMYGDETTDELDTEGTPGDSVEDAEDDGALAAEGKDEDDSDTDDGTPDEDESSDDSFEQRYKDTQAALTEKSQELATLKEEMAQQAGQLTETGLELQERLNEVQQVAEFYAQIADQDVMMLRQQNVQAMSQEQYAQWQAGMNAAGQRSQMLKQRLDQVKAHNEKVREDSINRAAQIPRAQLVRSIDNFDEAYPEIAKYAVQEGVNPTVFKEITDPGLIKIIHKAMSVDSAPDAIEEVVKKTQAKRKLATARKTPKPAHKTLADKLYGS